MSRDSGVTYTVVRQACCEILARGEQPSRPSVQEVLAREEFLGHKGSNSVVQRYLNDFRKELAVLISQPERTVPGVPDEYLAIQDKMLVEMVAVTRKIVEAEYLEREKALFVERQQMATEVENARQWASSADQLRIRAEAERDSLQGILNEWRDRSQAQAAEIAALSGSLKEKEETISLKLQEIEHARSSIAELKATQVDAEARHQEELDRLSQAAAQERARILQQVDDARQAARKEVKALNDTITGLQKSAGTLQAELGKARESKAVLTAEAKSLNDTISGLQKSASMLQTDLGQARESNATLTARAEAAQGAIAKMESDLASIRAATQAAERENITLTVKLSAAEDMRQEAVSRMSAMESELADLRAQVKYSPPPSSRK